MPEMGRVQKWVNKCSKADFFNAVIHYWADAWWVAGVALCAQHLALGFAPVTLSLTKRSPNKPVGGA